MKEGGTFPRATHTHPRHTYTDTNRPQATDIYKNTHIPMQTPHRLAVRHLRATGARRPEGRGLAGLRAGSRAGAVAWWLKRLPSSAGGTRGGSVRRHPHQKRAGLGVPLLQNIWPRNISTPGSLRRPSSRVKQGGTSILFTRRGSCLRTQACHWQSPKLPSPQGTGPFPGS